MAIFRYLDGASGPDDIAVSTASANLAYIDSTGPFSVPYPDGTTPRGPAPGYLVSEQHTSYLDGREHVYYLTGWIYTSTGIGGLDPNNPGNRFMSPSFYGVIDRLEIDGKYSVSPSPGYLYENPQSLPWRDPYYHQFLNGENPEDEFIGNDEDNMILGETMYQSFRNVLPPDQNPMGLSPIWGNDTIAAGGGNDTIDAGYGEAEIDGGDGFDFIHAGIQMGDNPGHVWSRLTQYQNYVDPSVDFANPELSGLIVNLSDSAARLTISDASILSLVDLDLHFPQYGLVNQLGAGRLIDSFQLTDEDADTVTSVEGVRGSAYGDIIVTAGAVDDSALGFGPGGLAFGEAGNDIIFITPGTAFVSGGQHQDLIIGGSGDDLANGDEGFDTLFGGDGSDTLWGGDQDDILDGGDGFDWVNTYNEVAGVQINLADRDLSLTGLMNYAELANFAARNWITDTPRSFVTARTLHDSFSSIDRVLNFEGVSGRPENDLLAGSEVGSQLFGQGGNDILIAMGGENTLAGGEAADFLTGAERSDVLDGGSGDDSLYGSSGDDHLTVGDGNDLAFGGAGSDHFYVRRGSGTSDGDNVFHGGEGENDVSALLDQDFVVYNQPQSLFTVRWGAQDNTAGFWISVTYDGAGNGTDMLYDLHGARFSNGEFTQDDIASSGYLGHMSMAVHQAFQAVPNWLTPPEDPSPWMQRFIAWMTVAERAAELGVEVFTSGDMEGAIRRFFVIGAKEVFNAMTGEARGWLDENVLNHLPASVRNRINDELDQIEGELREVVLQAADRIGTAYAQASQDTGEAIGDYLFDFYDAFTGEVENRYQDIRPNSTPRDDFRQNFDIDEILFDENNISPPPVLPDPQTPDQVDPQDTPEVILLSDAAVTINGELTALNGDSIEGFDTNDRIVISGENLSDRNITVTQGSAIIDIDRDLDGTSDATIRLEGDFSGIGFIATRDGTDTVLTPVALSEGETITGTDAADTLTGGDGGDVIKAARGDDSILAGQGNDSVWGDGGADTIDGGAGDDVLRGGREADTVYGGGGADVIRGQSHGDLLYGGAQADNIKGGGGNDTLSGDGGNDFLKGGSRRDLVEGGNGDDILAGNSFADTLDGGAGDDRLKGGGDDDLLIGGAGDDVLKGGSGSDAFSFDLGSGQDRIADFSVAEDRLLVTAALADGRSASQLAALAETSGGDLILALAPDVRITLVDLGLSGPLTASIEII